MEQFNRTTWQYKQAVLNLFEEIYWKVKGSENIEKSKHDSFQSWCYFQEWKRSTSSVGIQFKQMTQEAADYYRNMFNDLQPGAMVCTSKDTTIHSSRAEVLCCWSQALLLVTYNGTCHTNSICPLVLEIRDRRFRRNSQVWLWIAIRNKYDTYAYFGVTDEYLRRKYWKTDKKNSI